MLFVNLEGVSFLQRFVLMHFHSRNKMIPIGNIMIPRANIKISIENVTLIALHVLRSSKKL